MERRYSYGVFVGERLSASSARFRAFVIGCWMQQLQHLQQSSLAKGMNVWHVRINKRPFIVTPRHVILPHFPECRNLNKHLDPSLLGVGWKVTASTPMETGWCFENDLAWAESDDLSNAIDLVEVNDDHQEALLWYQPILTDGARVNDPKSLMFTTTWLSPSPMHGSQLLEVHGQTFRGMSGALAVIAKGTSFEAVGLVISSVCREDKRPAKPDSTAPSWANAMVQPITQ